MTRDTLVAMRARGCLGAAEDVTLRVPPEGEVVPKIKYDDEVVMFEAHVERGLALPASNFFSDLLEYFGLLPQHLSANSIMQLSAFAVLCEVYLGIWPNLDLFSRLFYLRARFKPNPEKLEELHEVPVDCSSAVVYRRPGNPLPSSKTTESVKNWQRTYFYARNRNKKADMVNLPAFQDAGPD